MMMMMMMQQRLPRVLWAVMFLGAGFSAALNDVCESATPIAIGETFSVDTALATPDNVPNDCFTNSVYLDLPGVWYTFLGTGERLLVRSCDLTFGGVDVSVFTGNCSNIDFHCVAGSKGLCSAARFMFDTIANTTYHALFRNYIRDFSNVTITLAPPPPVNEFCENATSIAIGETVMGNLTYATADPVSDDCFNDGFFVELPGMWYSFVGTGDRLVARSCNDLRTTTITILEGGCNMTNMKCVAGIRDVCALERASFDTVLGTTYYLLLRSSLYYGGGESIVDLSLTVGATVDNDFCENAQPFPIGSTVRVNLSYAAAEKDYIFADCTRGSGLARPYGFPDVWYTFVGNGKRMTARLNGVCNPDEAIAIAIFSGGCNVTNLQCEAGANYLCKRGRLLFQTVQGTTYHVIVLSQFPDSVVNLKIETCGLLHWGIFCLPKLAEFFAYLRDCLGSGIC